MTSPCRSASARRVAPWVALATLLGCAGPVAADELRVCADPNGLPYSDARGAGFENRIAELLGRDLGWPVTYAWRPQRRGFLRETLDAGRCDVVMGVPAGLEAVATTRPYYRSSYVFLARSGGPTRRASIPDVRPFAMKGQKMPSLPNHAAIEAALTQPLHPTFTRSGDMA